MFGDCYRGKTILITGHTGFKGSWLVSWLLDLGAKVVGYSKDVPSNPSLFELAELDTQITHLIEDVRDLQSLKSTLQDHRPDFVFHLAAQPLVSVSYEDPIETYSTNILGTANILEALRSIDWPCVAILITSDKCYSNAEWIWGYRETDSLGGKDVYSGSKGAAELVIKSMFQSFFNHEDSNVRIGIGRAGNVIGGGDWAKDRIVVDAIASWRTDTPVAIRSPNATRPWQHVLEPLSGYLRLGQELAGGRSASGEAYNFGPPGEQNRTVAQLLEQLFESWGNTVDFEPFTSVHADMHEAGLLKLNCDKAMQYIDWAPTLVFSETAELTACWYYDLYEKGADAGDLTRNNIKNYVSLATQRGRPWAEV